MCYCLNPECPAPGNQKTASPLQTRFCSNCGSKLLLGDRYRALKLIGQGGFGRTFLAIDEHKPSKPNCVIKQFCYPQSAVIPEKVTELFSQEALWLDELGQHPQIPALFAYVEEGQQKYLVQEFIDGQNLAEDFQKRGTFDEAQIRHLLTDLLPVLQYVHDHQVIHRDIKPENIIRRESDRHYVLVDFGASKLLIDEGQPSTKIGSQGYTAPEQAAGHATFTSDLYSLGATCVHLLTGLPPTHLFAEEEKIWYWRYHLPQMLSPGLERVLDRLLQIDLSQRYGSATDALKDLEAVKQTEKVLESTRRSPLWDIDSAKTIPVPSQANPSLTSSNLPQPPLHLKQSLSWECIQTMKAHDSWIGTMTFTPDGQTLISGSGDKTVKLWSAQSGEELRTLEAHTSWVRSIAINPNGTLLATAENDRTIRLWDLPTGKLQHSLTRHTDWVRAIAFSIDGRTLISGSQDKTAIVWDWETATPQQTLSGHQHWLLDVAISPDGQTIVTASQDHTLKIWHRETGKCRYSITGHQAEILATAISPDGAMVVSASADHTVRLWKLSNGKHLHTFTGHESAVGAIAISPDGKFLATGSNDQIIKIWRLDKGKLVSTLTGHEGWIWSLAFSPNSNLLASGSWDGVIKLWQWAPT